MNFPPLITRAQWEVRTSGYALHGYYIRKAETQVYFASDWAAVDIPERPALTLKASNISADGFTVTVDGSRQMLC